MIRGHGEVTKADLVGNTDYSLSKINGCIEGLIKKQYIQETALENVHRRQAFPDVCNQWFLGWLRRGYRRPARLVVPIRGKTPARHSLSASVRTTAHPSPWYPKN
jgi:hypothetical protein